MKSVLDVVMSFPAPVLLQRPSFLARIFDVLAVPFSHLDYGEFLFHTHISVILG
jgi:hypothetical protein